MYLIDFYEKLTNEKNVLVINKLFTHTRILTHNYVTIKHLKLFFIKTLFLSFG